MKRLLMIAFHFPPMAGSSGIQRTLRFVQHLPAFGWQPLVLTASVGAYERMSSDLDRELPRELAVRRAWAFDASRQLAVAGRYPAFLARPDRWMTWQFDGVRVGRAMIQEFRPDLLWSTYPIATAHVIGDKLRQATGLPWVADFRDPMAQDGYPSDAATWRSYKRIEQAAIAGSALSVFTTPGSAREYRRRYPAAAERIRVVENGYDESSFAEVAVQAQVAGALNPGMLTLLHSGIVYPSERDPRCLMRALGDLRRRGDLDAGSLRLRFRAPVHDELLRGLARDNGVEDLVEILPPVDYRDALAEMLRADGLLVLQAANCNEQVPAKLYEYVRARRPLLLLTDPNGDTARTAMEAGVAQVARLESVDEIRSLISAFLDKPAVRSSLLPKEAAVQEASREGRSRSLATLLDEAVACR